MAGLPKGFGIKIGGNPSVATSSKPSRTHPLTKKDGKTAVDVVDPLKKRATHQQTIPIEDAPSKKQKIAHFSLVSATLRPMAIPYVKDEDIANWKNRSPSKENEAVIRASSEILITALNRQSNLDQNRARLKSLESEKDKLCKQLKDASSKIDKLKAEMNYKDRYYKQELADKDEVLAGLNTAYDELEKEKNA